MFRNEKSSCFSDMIKIIISKNEKERRLDRFLKKYLKNMPLSGIYKLLRKDVKINGKREKANYHAAGAVCAAAAARRAGATAQ